MNILAHRKKNEEDRLGCIFANNGNERQNRARCRAVNAVESLRRCEQNRLPNDFIFATTTAEVRATPAATYGVDP